MEGSSDNDTSVLTEPSRRHTSENVLASDAVPEVGSPRPLHRKTSSRPRSSSSSDIFDSRPRNIQLPDHSSLNLEEVNRKGKGRAKKSARRASPAAVELEIQANVNESFIQDPDLNIAFCPQNKTSIYLFC